MCWGRRARIRRMKDWQVFAARKDLCARCSGKGTGLMCVDCALVWFEDQREFERQLLELKKSELG